MRGQHETDSGAGEERQGGMPDQQRPGERHEQHEALSPLGAHHQRQTVHRAAPWPDADCDR